METLDCRLFDSAIQGERGADQQRIAAVGMRWIQLLLAKNADYGGSAWKQPFLAPDIEPVEAILVRMSDKIERLRQLRSGKSDAAVADESYEDTMSDLGAYCLLYLARPRIPDSPRPLTANH